MENNRFYYCEICGNIIGKIHDSGVPLVCCGQPMDAFELHTEDGPYEKHKPVIVVEGNRVVVNIGSVAHPMTEDHHIVWIYLETTQGGHRKALTLDGDATVTFCLTEGEVARAVFSYCNLHGLWYAEV